MRLQKAYKLALVEHPELIARTAEGIPIKLTAAELGELSLLKRTADKVPGAAQKAVKSVAKQSTRITTKEAMAVAERLGFKKIKPCSHGQSVFKKGNKFITIDVDSHSGGFWKMADSFENLASKKTRLGTYDQLLNKIGD